MAVESSVAGIFKLQDMSTSGTVQQFVNQTAENIKSMVTLWSDIHGKFTQAVSMVCKRQETAGRRRAV